LKNHRFILFAGLLGIVLLTSAVVYWWMLPRSHGIRISKSKYPIRGIDVSSLNGTIHWDQIPQDSLQFAFIKATEGITRTDPAFLRNVEGARDISLRVGAYHFFLFDRDWDRQADNYLAAIEDVKLDLPPVVDVERYGPLNGHSRKSAKYITTALRSFIARVEKKTGRKVIIYTNKHGYNEFIRDHFPDKHVWICSFTHTLDEEINRDWVFWQHSHTGRIKGINSAVDLNAFYGSMDEWESFLGQW
jgi:lysozyme